MDDERIQTIIANSFKNFHAKGLDYICLKRTPEHTRKAYFLNGDVTKLPDVVNPHDHRYHFNTTVVTGTMSNSQYVESDSGIVYQQSNKAPDLDGLYDRFTADDVLDRLAVLRSFGVN